MNYLNQSSNFWRKRTIGLNSVIDPYCGLGMVETNKFSIKEHKQKCFRQIHTWFVKSSQGSSPLLFFFGDTDHGKVLPGDDGWAASPKKPGFVLIAWGKLSCRREHQPITLTWVNNIHCVKSVTMSMCDHCLTYPN